jgi:hypothetical protein
LRVYFFRRRLALATARRRHGANIEAGVASPLLDMSANPVAAAASVFSLSIRLYSTGEHLFCAISSARRATVSHDANISSVIIVGRDVFCRLRAFIMNGLGANFYQVPDRKTGEIYNHGGRRALLPNIPI